MKHIADVGVSEHKAVLHIANGGHGSAYSLRAYDSELIVPVSNVPELKRRLWMVLAYTEVIGNWTYDHYDVSGMRREHDGHGNQNN